MPIDSDTFGVKQAIVSKIILINSEHDIDNISEISDTSEQNVLLAVTKPTISRSWELMDIFFPMPFQCKRHKTNRNFDDFKPQFRPRTTNSKRYDTVYYYRCLRTLNLKFGLTKVDVTNVASDTIVHVEFPI